MGWFQTLRMVDEYEHITPTEFAQQVEAGAFDDVPDGVKDYIRHQEYQNSATYHDPFGPGFGQADFSNYQLPDGTACW